MTADKNTFQTVAAELAAAFETARRPGGEKFFRFRKDAPGWMDGLALSCHESVDGSDPRLPSDWIYSLMARAADYVADNLFEDASEAGRNVDGFAESCCDFGTADLFAWAADHAYNRALADEYAENAGMDYGQKLCGGFETAAVAALRGGQYLAAERVILRMIDAIEDEAESREE